MAIIEPFLQFGLLLGCALLCLGTAVSLWQHPHWAVRTWDFPRVQIASMLLLFSGAYLLFYWQGRWFDWALLAASAAALGWQAYRIYPYTRLAPMRIGRAQTRNAAIRVVSTNVLMENRQFDRWIETIRAADPDIILVLEPDSWWTGKMAVLTDEYDVVTSRPQDNCYGMACYSRLAFSDVSLSYRIQDDIPSLRCKLRLENGREVIFYGVHPRPPEPIRDVSAAPRDAEAIDIAREIAEQKKEEDIPTIVAGDFNDVAWSYTTELFMRISGLLDPRIGRGMFSTFPAHLPFLRFPLDHFFHSDHFTLVDVSRLGQVGSDHLPLSIHLALEAGASQAQDEFDVDPQHREDAHDRLDQSEELREEGKA